MLKLGNRAVNFKLLRTFTCSSGSLSSFKKEGKVLSKLMHGSEKGKRKWYVAKDAAAMFPSSSSLTSTQGQGKVSSRRLAVLNKLFMEQITDLMATGEHSEELVGYGIQISRVKVTSDFQGINVFWFARDSANDMEIGRLLKRSAGGLRHELSQLRLIGQVPKLNFVKDKAYGLTTDLDSVLRKADYGEDFVPNDPTMVLKSEIKLQIQLPQNVRKEIDKLEDQMEYPQLDQDPLPEMRHDVLGLDHRLIMSKVRRSLNRTKLAWSQYRQDSTSPVRLQTDEVVEQVNQAASDARERFQKFLERRGFAKNVPERKRFKPHFVDLSERSEEPEVLERDDDFLVEEAENNQADTKNKK